jgi:hypothetical protein
MQEFIQTLKGTDRVMYKAAYQFHLDNYDGATEVTAHEAGVAEIKRIAKIKEKYAKPQTWVDLATGETHSVIR